MLAIRLVKTAMVASLALFALLVAYNNLVDYDSNYAFVRHTLSMDTTFPDNALKGRAITSPALWTLAYWLIILTEAAIGIVLAFAALRLARAVRGPAACSTPPSHMSWSASGWASCCGSPASWWWAASGSLMWQSKTWNGQQAAFRLYMTLLAVVIFVSLRDGELDT